MTRTLVALAFAVAAARAQTSEATETPVTSTIVSTACSVATTTISDAAAASALGEACQTFTGDIELATGVADTVAFDGMERLEGNLTISQVTELTTLSSNSLQVITGDFNLEALTVLSNITFPALTSVGRLEMASLPALQNFTILRDLQQLTALSLDNTQINSLEGFGIETIDMVSIQNNPYLTSISFQPINVTGSLSIGASRYIDVALPRLTSAQNITLRNCSAISIPVLRQMTGSLGLYSNGIEQFDGAPLLQQIGGSLSFISNTNMTSILLPSLQTIQGGLQLDNNSQLTTVADWYSLVNVSGAVQFEGPFEDVSFPSLQRVGGAMIVNSTADMSCNSLDDLYRSNVIKGRYTCMSANDTADATTANSTSPSGGISTSSGSKGTSALRIGLGVGLGVGLGLLLLSMIVFFWLRRRKQRRSSQASSNNELLHEKDGYEVDRANMLDADVTQKHELEQPTGELGNGSEAQELPAKLETELELQRNGSTKALAGVESRHEMAANETPPVVEKGNPLDDDR